MMSFLSGLAILSTVMIHASFAEMLPGESESRNHGGTMAVVLSKRHLNPAPRVLRSEMMVSPKFSPIRVDRSRFLRFGAPIDDLEKTWNLIADMKREGLIPFPRTGRSGSGPKRNGAGTSGSLWFGPRLGKRGYLDIPLGDTSLEDDNAMDYFNQHKFTLEDLSSVKGEEFQ